MTALRVDAALYLNRYPLMRYRKVESPLARRMEPMLSDKDDALRLEHHEHNLLCV